MVYDPVHQGQLYLRRGGKLLRGKGARTVAEEAERRRVDGPERAQFFEMGQRQIAKLASDIEAHTGCTLKSRRALDYGCGIGRLALPLAERCEHVYGLDVSSSTLQEADLNAQRANLTNVEWMDAARLGELSGQYDMVLSKEVFQHIPSREGERIFAMLLRGLRPGGVGAIHMPLRPDRPLAGFLGHRKTAEGAAYRPDFSHLYMLMNTYSLNRLGRLLADAGVTEWHTKWHGRLKAYDAVTIIFRKD
jgi:trans-aconitate methyltransferase